MANESSEPLVTTIEPQISEGAHHRRWRRRRQQSSNMLPQRERRSLPERVLVRLIATCGIIAIGVAIGAIMTSSNSSGWMIGLIVAIVSVVLSAVLWSSRAV